MTTNSNSDLDRELISALLGICEVSIRIVKRLEGGALDGKGKRAVCPAGGSEA